ncbi:MAG: hypothetical protein GXY70_08385 [Euryarchaeota archaeon]|nr:hypothetical protein [Euryarchaeota archaeon]
MSLEDTSFLWIVLLIIMNIFLIITFRRIQSSLFRRRDGALDSLRRVGNYNERSFSWANESGLPLVVGSMLMFDTFFLIFSLSLDGNRSGTVNWSLLAALTLGFFSIISLGSSYSRINLKHIYVYDRNGIQSYFAGRNGPEVGVFLEWQGISSLKFIRTYRVPSAIGIELIGGNGKIVLPNYLKGHHVIRSHLIRFSHDEVRSAISAEYGEFIENDDD